MKPLDTFHPLLDTPENDTGPERGCSAHYFEIEGPMLGAGWYGQGLRLLDISNARDVRQVGYYRVTGTTPSSGANPSSNSWDMAFRDRARRARRGIAAPTYAFLFDMSRGVEVLRLKGGVERVSQDEEGRRPEQEARPLRRRGRRQRSATSVVRDDGGVELRLPAVPVVLCVRWGAVPRPARRPARASSCAGR